MRCETCRWWTGRVSGRVTDPGECRRYPPQITARVGQVPQAWPVTGYKQFCGEHQPRNHTEGRTDG